MLFSQPSKTRGQRRHSSCETSAMARRSGASSAASTFWSTVGVTGRRSRIATAEHAAERGQLERKAHRLRAEQTVQVLRRVVGVAGEDLVATLTVQDDLDPRVTR